VQAAHVDRSRAAALSKRALAGFFVLGLLLAFLGAVLPAWGYHLRPDFITIGNYFLAVNIGLFLSLCLSSTVLQRQGWAFGIAWGGLGAAFSLIVLAAIPVTAPDYLRLIGLVGLGAAAGILNASVFQAISPAYRIDPAGTVTLAGTLFGAGSLMAPVLTAGVFNLYSVPLVLLLFAAVPAALALAFAPITAHHEPRVAPRPPQELTRDFGNPGALLLSALLFFQFGNEWAIAGWLPLFLIQRLGISPVAALGILGLYWAALIVGRLLMRTGPFRIRHGRLLLASAAAAWFGCLVLALTNNRFGALLGTTMIGLAFAPVYPLVVERIGQRFPQYQPGFFNGVFSLGLVGGLLAPASLGYAAHWLGMRVVVMLPAAGTFIVLVLVVAIWTEARYRDWSTQTHR
jgi:fucose permease